MNSSSLSAFYMEKNILSKKFLKPVLLLSIAEIRLTAGEPESREDEFGTQGQKVAVWVSHTAGVDRSWRAKHRNIQKSIIRIWLNNKNMTWCGGAVVSSAVISVGSFLVHKTWCRRHVGCANMTYYDLLWPNMTYYDLIWPNMRCEWPCRDLSRVQPASGPKELGLAPGTHVWCYMCNQSPDTHIVHSHTQLMCFFREWERKTEKPSGEHAIGSGEEVDQNDTRWGATSCDYWTCLWASPRPPSLKQEEAQMCSVREDLTKLLPLLVSLRQLSSLPWHRSCDLQLSGDSAAQE